MARFENELRTLFEALMAEITLREETRRSVFILKFKVESGPRPTDYLPEAARLRLAFKLAPGSVRGKERQVGEYYYGQPEGAIDYYECSVEPTLANVAALQATEFAWEPVAAEVAARFAVEPAVVDQIRANMDLAHRNNVQKMMRYREMLDKGETSEEIRKEGLEAIQGLYG